MKDNANSLQDLIVVGGGAAGFFSAVNAARMAPGLKVVLVEKTGKLLSKVKISGGGRCNVTHACFDRREMSTRYPRGEHFVRKAFHQFFTTDTIKWFEDRGVDIRQESDGRMFPVTNTSQTIIDCLLREANKYGIEILLHAETGTVRQENGLFTLEGKDGRVLQCRFLCIATGGYPKSSMFDWLKQTGHSIHEPVPSLFTFNLPGHPLTQLMGVSVERVSIKIRGTKLEEEGPLLITHWGLSGPVVLRLSAWGARELFRLNYRAVLAINWCPEYSEQTMKDYLQDLRHSAGSQKIMTYRIPGIPQRLWQFICSLSGVLDIMRWADLPAAVQNRLVKNLCSFEASVSGKTTFKEEFVTAGGINLAEIDPATMMSKIVPDLYFAGEVMDVDGITGGFNFQHAWTSGFIAAKSISQASGR